MCDLEWSEWQTQGDCSHSCGGGTLQLIRNCTGENCTGSNVFDVPCNVMDCGGLFYIQAEKISFERLMAISALEVR